MGEKTKKQKVDTANLPKKTKNVSKKESSKTTKTVTETNNPGQQKTRLEANTEAVIMALPLGPAKAIYRFLFGEDFPTGAKQARLACCAAILAKLRDDDLSDIQPNGRRKLNFELDRKSARVTNFNPTKTRQEEHEATLQSAVNFIKEFSPQEITVGKASGANAKNALRSRYAKRYAEMHYEMVLLYEDNTISKTRDQMKTHEQHALNVEKYLHSELNKAYPKLWNDKITDKRGDECENIESRMFVYLAYKPAPN